MNIDSMFNLIYVVQRRSQNQSHTVYGGSMVVFTLCRMDSIVLTVRCREKRKRRLMRERFLSPCQLCF